jgi:hypothetical protein
MKSVLALFSLCLTLAFGAGLATAATVSYEFNVSGNAGSGTGSFQFDDTSGSANGFGETEFALTAFSFSFAGSTFGLGDLAYGFAVFDGGTLLGLDAAATNGAFSLLPATDVTDAFLVNRNQQSSDVSFRLDNGGGTTVPEPATLGLALAAAGLAFGLRRRHRG